MHKCFAIFLFVFLPWTVDQAAGEERPKRDDPMDVSGTQKRVQQFGVPTVTAVSALEQRATELFTKGDCANALPALEQFALQANWLANLIASGLQPFYNASYDERRVVLSSSQNLASFENLANEYKAKRDGAFVMQAECQMKLGRKDRAVSLLLHALDFISVNNQEWWSRARKTLYDTIGVK